MIFLFALKLLAYISLTIGQTVPPPACRPDVDGAVLDVCLRPLEAKWNATKKSKPQLEMLAFPLLGMDRKDMGPLCDIYQTAKSNCSAEMLACDHHPMVLFSQKNLDYACQLKSDFRKESECIWTTIQNNPQCSLSLKKLENVNDCKQISNFYKCMSPFIQVQCKTKGMAALIHVLDQFGCDTFLLDDDQKISECDKSDEQSISTCFQPLTDYWQQLRLNDSTLDGVAYPLFHFKGSDIVHMCDLVNSVKDDCTQLIRCPTHPVLSFTNSLLAVACGPQQSLFFLSFDCIKNTIKANEDCTQKMPGVWSPGKQKDSCWQVPSFFNCIKSQVLSRCSAEGLNVFAQSLKQFGCNVETTDWNGNWVALPPGIPQDFENGTVISQSRSIVSPQAQAQLFNAQGFALALIPPDAPIPDTFRPEPARPIPVNGTGNDTLSRLGIFPPGTARNAPSILPPPVSASATTPGFIPPPGLVPAPNFIPPPGLVPAASSASSPPRRQLLPDGLTLDSLVNSPPAAASPAIPSVQQLPKDTSATRVPIQVPVQLQGTFPGMSEPADICSKVRQCLQPLFTKWVQIQNNRNLSNLTFPTFHYDKKEIMDMCDLYAAAFVSCNHSAFQSCLQDEIVFLANSVFGYLCSPQNVVSFMQSFECITLTVRNRPICERPIMGQLVMGRDLATRCQGIHDFYVCNRLPIDRACGLDALKHVQETIKQFGCILESR